MRHDLGDLARRLYAAVVSDALDAFDATEQLLAPEIRPVVPLARPLVGRAATARSIPVDEAPKRPYATLLEAIDLLSDGEVWMIASEGAARSAIFGGLLATAASARRAAGCIVDGPVRDTRELERLAFPTFASGHSPADSYGRDEVIEHGVTIRCGGVLVSPGDLVIADRDGVAVVPAEIEDDVIDHALAKIAGEGNMRAELAAGMSATEAFAKYKIL